MERRVPFSAGMRFVTHKNKLIEQLNNYQETVVKVAFRLQPTRIPIAENQ
jgi:hypothetical protein